MVSAALGVAQTGAGLAGAASSAATTRQQGAIVEQQAKFNARVSDFQADEVIKQGKKEAQLAKKAGKKLVGKQRAALAAQGIELDDGTALALQEEAAELSAEDAENIRNNAAAEAFGFKVGASQERFRGKMAAAGAREEAASTLLTAGAAAARPLFESAVGSGRFLARQFGKSKGPDVQSAAKGVASGKFQSNIDSAINDALELK